jgi:putative hydrolase
MKSAINKEIAEKLSEMTVVLERQGADGYRTAAYRRAAETLRELGQPVDELVKEKGLDGLVELPTIGRGIGAAIVEMVTTGRWSQLERLTGELEPTKLLQTVPGIGPELAERIHDILHVDTLQALELEAHNGRLVEVPGIGERRAAAIRASLSERLGHRRVRGGHDDVAPPLGMLLDVDREYRERVEDGSLPRIAPKRFNPSGEAWLPVLHTRRDEWGVTVLFSNTRQAHRLGKSRDWVVIYYHQRGQPEAQCTVVTEIRGVLTGRRVVRGREGECISRYARASGEAA